MLFLLLALMSGGLAGAQRLPETIEFRFEGMKIDARTIADRVELQPPMVLLGAEIAFSEASGVWSIAYADHLIQIAPERKLILIDQELVETNQAPAPTLDGVAVHLGFLDRYILAYLGFHLESHQGGYTIVTGPRTGATVNVRPAAADFGATTTLVLALSRPCEVSVEHGTEPSVSVVFADATPRLDTTIPLRSTRVTAVSSRLSKLNIELAAGAGLLSWNVISDPDRVVLEFGHIPPTPTPAPVRVITRSGPPPIVIDPGHGGDDTGAQADSGLSEKELTLAIAQRLSRALRAKGYPVRLTRSDDTGKALTDRTSLANRLEARLFVSLHANSSTVQSVRGAETYYMSLDDRASDAQAQSVADLENRANGGSGGGGSSLDLILWDMAQSEVLNESAQFALKVQRRLNALLGLRDRGVKQAPFVVLTGATMPAVLIEVGFLSNPAERDRLTSPEHQRALADAIALGIEDFLAGS